MFLLVKAHPLVPNFTGGMGRYPTKNLLMFGEEGALRANLLGYPKSKNKCYNSVQNTPKRIFLIYTIYMFA